MSTGSPPTGRLEIPETVDPLPRRLRHTAFLLRRLVAEPGPRALTAGSVRQRRDGRAHEIVRFAYEEVPFYRRIMDECGLRPADVRTADDLARLPLLTADDVSGAGAELLPRDGPIDEMIATRTSGSSGIRRTVRHDVRGALTVLAACGRREKEALQEVIGKARIRRVALVMNPESNHLILAGQVRRRIALPRVALPEETVLPTDGDLEETIDRLARFAPDVLHGYGSSIGRLFRRLDEAGASIRPPRAITFTSDALSASERSLITDRFGVPVLGSYRSVEGFLLGFECGRGEGYHVNDDFFAVRVVDGEGRERPPGEPGDVVMSGLVNRGTVLLNYRLDDVAVRLEGDCPCGLPLPRIALLEGRLSRMVRLPDGREVHPFDLLAGVFLDFPVWRWQVVQEQPDRFRLRFVVTDAADRAAMRRVVPDRFRDNVGFAAHVDVEFVDELTRTEAGKVLPLVRE